MSNDNDAGKWDRFFTPTEDTTSVYIGDWQTGATRVRLTGEAVCSWLATREPTLQAITAEYGSEPTSLMFWEPGNVIAEWMVFQFWSHANRGRPDCHGITFHFNDKPTALLFKLTFGGAV